MKPNTHVRQMFIINYLDIQQLVDDHRTAIGDTVFGEAQVARGDIISIDLFDKA